MRGSNGILALTVGFGGTLGAGDLLSPPVKTFSFNTGLQLSRFIVTLTVGSVRMETGRGSMAVSVVDEEFRHVTTVDVSTSGNNVTHVICPNLFSSSLNGSILIVLSGPPNVQFHGQVVVSRLV